MQALRSDAAYLRPQIFGVTYMVVAPEYAGLEALTGDAQQAAVTAYVRAAATKSDLERTELAKSKTGVFTGASPPSSAAPTQCRTFSIGIVQYKL